ncbi:hypothetical protein P5673_010008 [Acropora cervicornis]|uniref:Uncharacterized protein n=1 Tax=Acropora cervicornis TaxID=6130 RepID=A0AAD9QSD5_ACRCE|nr:hypothetical protein P5673_010008 [Acropora cervicornis]
MLSSDTALEGLMSRVLGDLLKEGIGLACPHHIVAFLASCPAPDTVTRMRSFIGTFKVLFRVIPGCSTLLIKLDDTIAGRESKATIQWTGGLRASF